jgi:hypothetical protein
VNKWGGWSTAILYSCVGCIELLLEFDVCLVVVKSVESCVVLGKCRSLVVDALCSIY